MKKIHAGTPLNMFCRACQIFSKRFNERFFYFQFPTTIKHYGFINGLDFSPVNPYNVAVSYSTKVYILHCVSELGSTQNFLEKLEKRCELTGNRYFRNFSSCIKKMCRQFVLNAYRRII